MQIGRGEPISDTAKVLSRYVDVIMIRANKHETLTELAEHATVPVINGLTDRTPSLPDRRRHHDVRGGQGPDQGPQGRLDRRRQQRRRLVDPGRGAARLQAARSPVRRSSIPSTRSSTGPSARAATIALTDDPDEAVRGADCVVTDTWVSMGQQTDGVAAQAAAGALSPSTSADAAGAPGAIFMHACRPIAAMRCRPR